MLRSELGAVAGPFDDDLMGRVGQPIQCAISQNRIVEQRQPLVHASICSNAKTRPAMALDDQLVQIVALLGVEATEPKVIEDDEVWRQVPTKDLVVRAVCSRLAQLGQEGVGANEDHRVAGAHGRGAEALSEQGLSDADGANKDAMLLARQELQREHVLELTSVELDRRGPVEAVQGDAILEASLQQVAFERLLVTPLHLVGEQQREENRVIQVLRAGQRESFGQRRQQRAKLEAFEQANQIGIDGRVHGSVSDGTPTKRWSNARPGRAKRPGGNAWRRCSVAGTGCASCSRASTRMRSRRRTSI